MKLDCVLTACNLNPLYTEFIPIFIKAWTHLYPTIDVKIILIADTIPDEFKAYEKYIILFHPIEGVSDIFISQSIRLLYPAILPYTNAVLISDMDMIPMNPTYFSTPLLPHESDSFVHFRNGAELWHGAYQYAMCYNAATPAIWGEITGIKTESDIRSFIFQKYTSIPSFTGVPDESGWYSDQILLYSLLTAWPRKKIVCLKDHETGYHRLDRGFTRPLHELLPMIQTCTFSDYHCYRPYSIYKDLNDTIVANLPPPEKN